MLHKCCSASKEFKIELCLTAECISTVNLLQANDRVSAMMELWSSFELVS